MGVITDKWMKKQNPAEPASPRMPAFIWLNAVLLVSLHFLRAIVDSSSSTFFIGMLLFGCGMALTGSTALYGLLAMENGPPGYSGTTHAIVALGSSLGGVVAGYPMATFGKKYGWDQTFFLFQILAALNLLVHIWTRNLNKNMVDLNKVD